MSKDASFDIVSKVDMAEVTNAVHQTNKEIEQRFDLKGSGAEIRQEKDSLVAVAPDDLKLRNIIDILENKFVRRNLSLKAMDKGEVEPALGGTVKQTITLRQGIDRERAKKIIDLIKGMKLKVQSQIQEDQIRVSGKSRDDLQAVIKHLKQADLDIDLQFENYR